MIVVITEMYIAVDKPKIPRSFIGPEVLGIATFGPSSAKLFILQVGTDSK